MYLLAEHGPGYSVWFLEAGHMVLPKRQAMMLVEWRQATRYYLPSYQNSNVEQHFFVASFFLLSVWSFKKKKKRQLGLIKLVGVP